MFPDVFLILDRGSERRCGTCLDTAQASLAVTVIDPLVDHPFLALAIDARLPGEAEVGAGVFTVTVVDAVLGEELRYVTGARGGQVSEYRVARVDHGAADRSVLVTQRRDEPGRRLLGMLDRAGVFFQLHLPVSPVESAEVSLQHFGIFVTQGAGDGLSHRLGVHEAAGPGHRPEKPRVGSALPLPRDPDGVHPPQAAAAQAHLLAHLIHRVPELTT